MANEKRLIDANALLEKLKKTSRYFTVKFDIEEAPTVDAVEVVHGRWLQHIVNNYGIKRYIGFTASCCGRWSKNQTRYCPNCGAKMDGDGNV